MGGSRGADWTGYGWLAEEDRNRGKREKRKKEKKRQRTGRGGVTRERGKIELQGGKGNAPGMSSWTFLFIYLFYCIFFIIISGYCFFGLDTRLCWKSCTC